MNKNIIFITLLGSIGLSGCVWKSFGSPVASIESCSEYDQVATNTEVLVKAAEKLQVEGRITENELMNIDQNAGLYSKRLKDSCNFFINERITFEEYQKAVGMANNDYEKLRALVQSK